MLTVLRSVPTGRELCDALPLSDAAKKAKAENDFILKEIISGKDKRKLVVCGPCSADNPQAAAEFCVRLKSVADKVKDRLFLTPRLYIAKARTRGEDYQGLLLDLKEGGSLSDNVLLCRRMFTEVLEQTGLPIADELLFAEQTELFGDLVSYYFIGARQCDSPFFRGLASGLDVAVGVKNNLAGNLRLIFRILLQLTIRLVDFRLREREYLLLADNEVGYFVFGNSPTYQVEVTFKFQRQFDAAFVTDFLS